MYICPSVMYPVRSGVGCVISVEPKKKSQNIKHRVPVCKSRKAVFVHKEKLISEGTAAADGPIQAGVQRNLDTMQTLSHIDFLFMTYHH